LKQIVSAAPRADRREGFTLVEALAALVVSAAIMVLLAELAGQSLRNWNRNAATITDTDMLTTGLGRFARDLAHTLPITDPKSRPEQLLFNGTADTLILPVVADPADGGIEMVAVTVVAGLHERALERRRGPLYSGIAALGHAVTLLRGAFDIRFAYLGYAGERVAEWSGGQSLPRAVEITLADGQRGLPAVILPIAVNLPADCIAASGAGKLRCALRSPGSPTTGR
jgi:general secretion pathway protein J